MKELRRKHNRLSNFLKELIFEDEIEIMFKYCTILSFTIFAAAVSATPEENDIKQAWNAFKTKYAKTYEIQAEELYRMQIFAEHVKIVNQHNRLYEEGKEKFKMCIYGHADLTEEEFGKQMNGNIPIDDKNEVVIEKSMKLPKYRKLPKSVEWRQKGAVTAVKYQGTTCSSCWAFAAVGALEGQHFIKTGQLVSLSEQNLIDCSSSFGNHGCQNGYIHEAFEYIRHNGGVESDSTYPYTRMVNKCKYNSSLSAAMDFGFVQTARSDEEDLKSAIALQGPIAVQINANLVSFQYYAGGIYHDRNCDSKDLNHAVLTVGYGTDENGTDFYIVKNSWGKDWGENGYVRMIRNQNNHCGIATYGFYPIV